MRIVLTLSVLLCLLTGSAWAAADVSITEVAKDGGMEAAKAVNAFALSAYEMIADQKEGNFFFSPYSISSALGMTYAGADGRTAEEIARALVFPDGTSEEKRAFHESMKALYDRFNGIPEQMGSLEVANRIWLAKEADLLADYTRLANDCYGGGVERLDFSKNAKGALKAINGWVEEKTRDKIKNLLQQGDVDEGTRMVLTNAIYFKSSWFDTFKKEATGSEIFRSGEKIKIVKMMHRAGNYLYGEFDGVQAIKIPYGIRGFSMTVLLPREKKDLSGLAALEEKLAASGAAESVLAAWTREMSMRRVNLRLPRFKDEGRISLKELLEKRGMKLAFTDDADFSKMVAENNVKVDAVVHQSFIEVDEEGTEAAAATAVIMTTKAALPPREPEVDFRADHPFVYMIMDDQTGTILFMGRLTEPN